MIINTGRLITKHGELQVPETLESLQHALICEYEMGRDTTSLRSDLAFIRGMARIGGKDRSSSNTSTPRSSSNTSAPPSRLNMPEEASAIELRRKAASFLITAEDLDMNYFDRSELISGMV